MSTRPREHIADTAEAHQREEADLLTAARRTVEAAEASLLERQRAVEDTQRRLATAREVEALLLASARSSSNGSRSSGSGEPPAAPLSEAQLALIASRLASVGPKRAACIVPLLEDPTKIVWTTDEILAALHEPPEDRIRVRTNLKRLQTESGLLGSRSGRGAQPSEWWLAPPEGGAR
jgi:hypothetical protein